MHGLFDSLSVRRRLFELQGFGLFSRFDDCAWSLPGPAEYAPLLHEIHACFLQEVLVLLLGSEVALLELVVELVFLDDFGLERLGFGVLVLSARDDVLVLVSEVGSHSGLHFHLVLQFLLDRRGPHFKSVDDGLFIAVEPDEVELNRGLGVVKAENRAVGPTRI